MSGSIMIESMLVIDVGTVTTRSFLFDVVSGQYRFVACGSWPTTAGAPFHDVSEGVRKAVDQLQKVTGRILIAPDERLVMPSNPDGSGIDAFAATVSAGSPIKSVLVGLLEDVSLESARRLSATSYTQIIDTLSLNDRRKTEDRLDAILRARPDLIIAVGGTDGGAAQSMLKLLEAVGLAGYLLPEALRPHVLYAGNQALQDEVQATLSNLVYLHLAPNVRPTLEAEQLDAAQTSMAEIFTNIRIRQIAGLKELRDWAGGNIMPTASAMGRIIRFLSKAHVSDKGVLGIDIGAGATSVAAAFNGDLIQGVYPQYGLGVGIPGIIQNCKIEEVTRWLSSPVSGDNVKEYAYNKMLYPSSLPATLEEEAIEQALARQAIQYAVRQTAGGFPAWVQTKSGSFLPWVEPVIATGSVLTRAPSLAQAALLLLDGLQPVGATTLILDQNHLSPALGAAAVVNPMMAIQVLDSNAFLHLGTVIAPISNTRPGTPILHLKISYDEAQETSVEIKQGTLEVLPLPSGQAARLHLQPLNRCDVGMGGPGRSGVLRVMGGVLGVIIDARGRPLQLPNDSARRAELFKKWLWTLGG